MSVTAEQLTAAVRVALTNADDWITVEEWCRSTGDGEQAVYSRRSKGIWLDGVHSSRPKGGGLWINRTAAQAWAAGRQVSAKSGSPRA